jgi:hypothetical protein
MAPRGRSGGMMLGVHLLTFDIGEIEEGDFFIRFKLRHREEDFILILFQYMVQLRWIISLVSCLSWFEYVQKKPYPLLWVVTLTLFVDLTRKIMITTVIDDLLCSMR